MKIIQTFKNLKEINKKLDSLRLHIKSQKDFPISIPNDVFLIPITCRSNKSIIAVSQKSKFKEQLKSIEQEIEKYKKGTLENLEEEMLERKKAIKKELSDFLNENPPQSYSNYNDDLFARKIEDEAQKIISKIKFPEVADLISNARLIYNFYDLTIEDFKDEKFN